MNLISLKENKKEDPVIYLDSPVTDEFRFLFCGYVKDFYNPDKSNSWNSWNNDVILEVNTDYFRNKTTADDVLNIALDTGKYIILHRMDGYRDRFESIMKAIFWTFFEKDENILKHGNFKAKKDFRTMFTQVKFYIHWDYRSVIINIPRIESEQDRKQVFKQAKAFKTNEYTTMIDILDAGRRVSLNFNLEKLKWDCCALDY